MKKILILITLNLTLVSGTAQVKKPKMNLSVLDKTVSVKDVSKSPYSHTCLDKTGPLIKKASRYGIVLTVTDFHMIGISPEYEVYACKGCKWEYYFNSPLMREVKSIDFNNFWEINDTTSWKYKNN